MAGRRARTDLAGPHSMVAAWLHRAPGCRCRGCSGPGASPAPAGVWPLSSPCGLCAEPWGAPTVEGHLSTGPGMTRGSDSRAPT